MKKLFLVIAIILTVGISGATDISSENLTVDLESSEITGSLEIAKLTTSNFAYTTPYEVDNVNVQIEGKNKSCEVKILQIGSEIRCPTETQNNLTVDMSFTATEMYQRRNGINTVRYRKSFSSPTKNFRMNIILPQGTGIVDQENVSAPVIFPENYNVGSTGRRITVSWTEEPQLGDSKEYQVMYEKLSDQGEDTFNYIPLILGLIGLGIVLFILIRIKNKSELTELYEDLSDDEIKLLELLKEENGEMLQKNAVDESEYSKAKISEVVSSLEEKEIIVKEKDGRSNKIKIKGNYRF